MNSTVTKLGVSVKWLGMAVLCAATASCSTTSETKTKPKRSKEYFSESEYGVKASPRVADGENIPKGGGRFLVGNAYTVKGRRYFPKEEQNYDKSGLASWYGSAFHGRLTANGEAYDKEHLSAAHPTFPLPSYARVTNTNTGSSVIVRVNDRGPFHEGRLIDVSSKAADLLDIKGTGTGNVRVQYVGRAPLDGHDMPYLMASYIPKGSRGPAVNPQGQIATGVMVASASPSYIPVPASPSYSGSAQTALVGGKTNQALQAMPLVNGPAPARGQGAEQFVVLPEIGPFINERPEGNFLRVPKPSSKYASAYSEAAPVSKAEQAFDSVLVKRGELTEQSILNFVKNKQGKGR
ncbi:septal ring lytic transglycosylase RlpA family protein [Agrobacterium sp. rho-13.3]|uniref:septal ring lytic transglycosylase RlpA family protein n=1 Tax=Agrobacterium sp. rho-13.3 TaxID=3072980 RepID=UPI002A10CAEF|nr:septal ring lytic transglycosylase RlpA family protein [Agrobacterium sp. rho-13.3]MDX8309480.1 septal ring lytic transglycosylase RlpA family protein [Agrobacterium sp. rho-13.3]